MQKNQFAIFISILLAGLTLAVGGVGLYTYQNLEKVVNQLKYESGPNYNLIILKDIMVSISGIENDMEAFLLTENQTYLNRYDQRIGDANQYLDSLQRMNRTDKDFIRYTDSLKSLISKKVAILNQFQQSISYNLDGTINEFAKKLDQLSIDTSNPDHDSLITEKSDVADSSSIDTLQADQKKERKGFFKGIISLFSKDKSPQDSIVINEVKEQVTENSSQGKVFRTDSAFIAQKTIEYRNTLQNELFQLRKKSAIIGEDMRQQELMLSQNQQIIQNQIIDLLTYLEEREIAKIKIKNYNAQLIADETNGQVIVFSILTTILLLVTIVVIWSYTQKSKAYQKILRKATTDARKLAKAKEQFLANMSHEIRTPMNAIYGFTQQLLKTDLSDTQKEQLDIIDRSSEHLLHLLNDVLDFSKLQANKLRLDEIDFDLPLLMTDTIKLMQLKAIEKGLTLNYVKGDIPEVVNGDPFRLRQVLINLMSNSIKFTEKGEVTVSINATKKSKSTCVLELTVKDTGIGIPKDQHKRILMEFEQAGSSSDHKGTGLGLSITKKIVALHKGKMKLKSTPGRGTAIDILLPYKISHHTIPSKPKGQVTNLEGVRLLIADDEPFNLKLLGTILKNRGMKWDESRDGTEALRQLQNGTYDLALLDIKMPGLSGYQVADQLRKTDGPNKNLPLIALTATVTKEEFDKCMDAGFSHVIRKPFKEEELIETMVSIITGKGSEKAPSTISIHRQSVNAIYSIDSLSKMGDELFLVEMIQMFIDGTVKSLAIIEKSIATKNWQNVANEAHKMVAPARHLEAEKVVDLLKKMELKAMSSTPTITIIELDELTLHINQLNQELKEHIKTVHS